MCMEYREASHEMKKERSNRWIETRIYKKNGVTLLNIQKNLSLNNILSIEMTQNKKKYIYTYFH